MKYAHTVIKIMVNIKNFYSKRHIDVTLPQRISLALNALVLKLLPSSEAALDVLFGVFMRPDHYSEAAAQSHPTESQACEHVTVASPTSSTRLNPV